MHTTFIRGDSTLSLGDAASDLGFRPGVVVDIVVLSSGSLLVRLSDTPALDLPPARALSTPPATAHDRENLVMAHYRTRMARGERDVACAQRSKIELGETVRRLRQQAGLYQAELAKRAHVGQSTISNIERGLFRPGRDLLLSVASALDLDETTKDGLIETAGYETRRAS